MSFERSIQGFVLRCEANGIIQRVIYDGLGIDLQEKDESLWQLVDSGNRVKLFNFFAELRGKGTALDWEINIYKDGHPKTIRFTGVTSADTLFIVGARTKVEVLYLLEKLVENNDGPEEKIRMAITSQMQSSRGPTEKNTDLFDEISRQNNELVTLHRKLAKKNAELEKLYTEVQKLAVIDPLTQLYNRRGFFVRGEQEIARAKRFNNLLTGIMVDLDNFKSVNDNYGHTIGDKILEETAARFSLRLRQVDILGRFGGDEFSILLPETGLADSCIVAEELRLAAEMPVETSSGRLVVTVSVGLAPITKDTVDLSELLNAADRALYDAKGLGGNQVRVNDK